MSQPPAMTVATRRALVRQLAEQDPTLSARNIAAQVGVSKDTIRHDLAAIREAQRQDEPDEQPDDDRLVLVLDEPLRQALAVLRAQVRQPDTEAANVRAARAAIRALADHLIEEQDHSKAGHAR